MSLMDKFLNVMRLNPDDDDYDFDNDDYMDDDELEDEPVAKKNVFKSRNREDHEIEQPKEKVVKTTPKITPISKGKGKQGGGMEVCVIKPTTVEDAREITETLLTNRTVVLNLEGLDVDVAQRIIDFTSGSCFAIQGNLQKISHYIFIITPASVDISGDFQDILAGSFDVPSLNPEL